MIDFKGSQFEQGIILWGVRWYVEYPISYRQLEEMMKERGVEVDHSSLNRWVLKYTPELDKAFRQRKRPVGGSWRMDGTVRPPCVFFEKRQCKTGCLSKSPSTRAVTMHRR